MRRFRIRHKRGFWPFTEPYLVVEVGDKYPDGIPSSLAGTWEWRPATVYDCPKGTEFGPGDVVIRGDRGRRGELG